MSKTNIILNAIKKMDINLLNLVLDNKYSYLDVPKELFIKELSSKFERLKKQGITEFSNVSKGTCQECYEGCVGYTFLTKKNDYLDLLIEEKDNGIIDITQCTTFKNDEKITKEKNIFLYFKRDLKDSYIPTSLHLQQQKAIEKAENEFKEFENQIIHLVVIENWVDKWSKLFDDTKDMDFYYSYLCSFNSTYFAAKYISSLKGENKLAEKAIFEFYNIKITNSKELISWLLKYRGNQIYFAISSFTKTKNWQETNFVIFKNKEDIFNYGLKYYENIIIDIKGYKKSIEFGEIYSKYYHEFYEEIEGN